MFPSRAIVVALALVLLVAIALGAARPSSGASPETRYVVEPGDTLWGIASEWYADDPRKGVWLIEKRNGLETTNLQPGVELVLPPA
jgi:LysM repeat protein